MISPNLLNLLHMRQVMAANTGNQMQTPDQNPGMLFQNLQSFNTNNIMTPQNFENSMNTGNNDSEHPLQACLLKLMEQNEALVRGIRANLLNQLLINSNQPQIKMNQPKKLHETIKVLIPPTELFTAKMVSIPQPIVSPAETTCTSQINFEDKVESMCDSVDIKKENLDIILETEELKAPETEEEDEETKELEPEPVLELKPIKKNIIRKKISKRKRRKSNVCGHLDRDHYAKNLCYNCYHRKGRTKKPWNCSHDRLYAQGLCQNCYINEYNRKKRLNEVKKSEDEIESEEF
jgi:hypothetical protein